LPGGVLVLVVVVAAAPPPVAAVSIAVETKLIITLMTPKEDPNRGRSLQRR
jgi:hypothetical protein